VNSQNVLIKAFWAISVVLASSAVALGQNGPAADLAATGSGEGPLPPSSETTSDLSRGDGGRDVGFSQTCCGPRWTASADFIILDRVGSVNQTLVATVPGLSPHGQGTEALNATDLHQGFSGGPRLDLIHHGDDGTDLEVSYSQIDGWNACRSVGPTPGAWLVMQAPGGFLQPQEASDQMMVWDYASRLYNAEANVRWNPWCRVTILAGFRWVQLWEELEGILEPPTAHGTGSFWDTQPKNNLYGLQVGAEGTLFERGRFSVRCMGKAGLFEDHAEETTLVRMARIQFEESGSTDHAAFVGEIGVECKYQVAERLSLRAGYQAMWLEGIALAPGQIQETYCHYDIVPQNAYVQSMGVNCSSGVFYHGATAGLEYSF